MSDTVKLIIEIPKETKQLFDKTESINLGIVGRAVQNGIPLDFLNFIYQVIPPNEMEKYIEMYNCRNDKNNC